MPSDLTLLVDSASLIYRAFYSTPDTVVAPDGSLMNAAHGFLNMLARLISDRRPTFICCAADDDWRPEWRVDLIESYKAHRAEEGSVQEQAEEQLEHQVEAILEILLACGIPVVGHPDYEAEDVIGTLSARAPGPVEIVSGDRDLFQLVRDPDVVVIYPKRGVSVVERVDESYIQTKYSIPGRKYADYALLRGDPSDGLPGVRGIGDKLASGLLSRHGSLDAIVAAAKEPGPSVPLSKVRGSLDYIERARKVITIPTDLPIPPVDLRTPGPPASQELDDLATELGLAGPVQRLASALAAAAR